MRSASDEQREANDLLRAELLASGTLDLKSLRLLRGDADTDSTWAWVQRQGKGVLAVVGADGALYPAFQFNDAGGLRAELADHTRLLQEAGLGPWQTWAWLTSPAALLSGAVPTALLRENPGRVATAVNRLAARSGDGAATPDHPPEN